MPIAALVAGVFLPGWRLWLWIPALVVMGTACLVNASRCRRLHCYFTGPLYLIAAGYLIAVGLKAVPMISPGVFLLLLLGFSLLALLAESLFGAYVGSRSEPSDSK